MNLKPGSRWQSAVSDTELAVVRAPRTPVTIACGSSAMLPMGQPRPDGVAAEPGGGATLLGKRYADPESGLEVLCTKGGTGLLTADGRTLQMKEAKALPSSD